MGLGIPSASPEAIRRLRRGVRDVETLPSVLPAERDRARALDVIDEGLAAGKNWKMIAADVNKSEMRPPRGTAFTPVQVRLLYLRAHGLRSFKLPAGATKQERLGA